MVKRKGLTSTAWILIVAVALVGGGIVSGNIDFSAVGGDEDVQPKDDDAVASMSFKVKDALNDDLSYTAAQYYVYDSDGLQVASGTTSTNSFTSVTDLDENSDYTVHVVDDDGSDSDEMYHAVKQVSTGESVSRFVVEADRQGTLTTSVIEDSGSEDDGTITLNQGQTDTVTLEMEENTADAAYNNPAVFVKTNDTSAITDVEVSGASSVDVPDRISSYSDGYDTGIDQLADFETGQVDVQITRDDSNTDPATVTLLVADGDEYQTGQDTWEFGFEDDSDSDIRATDYTQTVTVN